MAFYSKIKIPESRKKTLFTGSKKIEIHKSNYGQL